jgi:hypothetical protein
MNHNDCYNLKSTKLNFSVVDCDSVKNTSTLPVNNRENYVSSFCTKTEKYFGDDLVILRDCGYKLKKVSLSERSIIDEIFEETEVDRDDCVYPSTLRPDEIHCVCYGDLCNGVDGLGGKIVVVVTLLGILGSLAI